VRVTVNARGLRLPMPVPTTPSTFFASDPAVTVQLVSSGGGCLTADFPVAKRNTSSSFKATLP
jgi:hypothetical protein